MQSDSSQMLALIISALVSPNGESDLSPHIGKTPKSMMKGLPLKPLPAIVALGKGTARQRAEGNLHKEIPPELVTAGPEVDPSALTRELTVWGCATIRLNLLGGAKLLAEQDQQLGPQKVINPRQAPEDITMRDLVEQLSYLLIVKVDTVDNHLQLGEDSSLHHRLGGYNRRGDEDLLLLHPASLAIAGGLSLLPPGRNPLAQGRAKRSCSLCR